MRTGIKGLLIIGAVAVILMALVIGLNFPVNIIWPAMNGPLIESNAKRYNIDPLLITALIKTESHFFRRARSHRGAVGLMQLMPSTAHEMATELGMGKITDADLESPEINIRLGSYYLSKLIDQSNGNIVLALASYNAGLSKVQNWYKENPLLIWEISDIPYAETRNYVKDVKRTFTWLKRIQRLKGLIQSETH